MIHVEIHASIRRPIEDVFDRLVDIDAYAQWMPTHGLFVSSTSGSGGPVGAGTTYTDRTRVGTVHGEVVTFEPPRRVVFHYTVRLLGWAAMEGWPGHTLERDGEDRTRVHHLAEGRLYGPARLLRPLIQRLAEGERQRTVDGLKASLEGE